MADVLDVLITPRTMMADSGDISSESKGKRTPLGGGKLSRKRQARLAAQARWKSSSEAKEVSGTDHVNGVGEPEKQRL